MMLAVAAATAYAATSAVVFTKTPPAQTNNTSAHFAWTGTAPFKCSLDGATATACESPQDFTGLSEGPHKFRCKKRAPALAHPSSTTGQST
jgi:hypothetical protein